MEPITDNRETITPMEAIKNLLTNTDHVLDGNGVHSDGGLYIDVEQGPRIALKLLEGS
ncbi:hypothetical protein N9E48_01875 [Paracoccaceae bacterium]|nr:hypothetical protein [Paracoccaceae bacterium]